MRETGGPMHGANVELVELGRSALADDDGSFRFDSVPPGTFQVVAHLDHIFRESAQAVQVAPGEEASVSLILSIVADRQEITVTASDHHETTFEAFQSIEALDTYELTTVAAESLGEALDRRVGSGIAKRGFGPAHARPIIRGFDGDRVLVMQDGINMGTLGYSSGHHGESVQIGQLARLEVVKGPATLLYSGNAMGGTVNAVSRHHEHDRHAHPGFRGFVSGSAGTTNALLGGNAGFEAGTGSLLLWGHGGAVRTGDYGTPGQGTIYNTRVRNESGGGGIGWFGESMFLTLGAQVSGGDAGIPFGEVFHEHHDHEHHDHEHHGDESAGEQAGEEEGHEEKNVDRLSLQSQWENFRVTWGLQDLKGPIDRFDLKLNLSDWSHNELEVLNDGTAKIGSRYENEQFRFRGVFRQQEHGPLSGRFGVWGVHRVYEVTGAEALSPPVDQGNFALFALEELEFERVNLQFGGRVEARRYNPALPERGAHHDHGDEDGEEGEGDGEHREHHAPDVVPTTLTGLSLAAGLHADGWSGGAFVANVSRSFRPPSLEELYNFGPHFGERTFEVGDPGLSPEVGHGVDMSLRHSGGRVSGELNLFYYGFENFVFPFATGELVDELLEIEYTQTAARFAGTEASIGLELNRAVRLNLGMDYVDAKNPDTGTYLPRIPPLRGTVGVELRRGGLRVAPRVIIADRQARTFTKERSTSAYTLVDLDAAYVFAPVHATHQFAVNVFNIGDRLYRNHSSFIKDLAPEIGRGVRFSYTMRFF